MWGVGVREGGARAQDRGEAGRGPPAPLSIIPLTVPAPGTCPPLARAVGVQWGGSGIRHLSASETTRKEASLSSDLSCAIATSCPREGVRHLGHGDSGWASNDECHSSRLRADGEAAHGLHQERGQRAHRGTRGLPHDGECRAGGSRRSVAGGEPRALEPAFPQRKSCQTSASLPFVPTCF